MFHKKAVKDLTENELVMILLRNLWMLCKKRKRITTEIKLLFAASNLIPMPSVANIDEFNQKDLLTEAKKRIEKAQKKHKIPLPPNFHKFFEM